jgi:hypothetical protein
LTRHYVNSYELWNLNLSEWSVFFSIKLFSFLLILQVGLIVVDSLAYPFRFVDFKDSNSMSMKTNILNNFMLNAYQLITKYKLAVNKYFLLSLIKDALIFNCILNAIKIVITNQMTTRITRDSVTNTSTSSLVPALGETWAHSANIRLVLSWKNDKRYAWLCKASFLPDALISYRITSAGFEALLEDREECAKEEDEDDDQLLIKQESFINLMKRRRYDEQD